ncbi:hypothetical protein QYM36_007361 [Artemia franciscana]|uniref:Uncharacterized protein n=1 Tax=Artemia franciscana TaxID=6661 RepID=A0AA88HZJ6_ARTSF|nr:hypothetical protein QYM36_007361 [Artemia franciscana]
MSFLWPNGVLHGKVLFIFVRHYSVRGESEKGIEGILPDYDPCNLPRTALHRVGEIVKLQFPDVDSLISNVKNVFLRAPIQMNMFKELYPDLSLHLQPVITKWGTWLEAADYYSKNFGSIKNVLSEQDSSSAMAIEQAKAIIDQPILKNNLACISSNACFLIHSIAKLES